MESLIIDEEDIGLVLDLASELTDTAMVTFLNARKNTLKCLRFHGNGQISDESYKLLQHCQHLEDLEIHYALGIGNAGLMAISKLKNLKNFTLTCSSALNPSQFCSLFNEGNFENLIHTNLEDCTQINDEVVKIIATKSSKLETLALSNCDVSDEGVLFIMKNCKNIESLGLLSLKNLTNKILNEIHEQLPKLRHLDLSICNLDVKDSRLKEIILKYDNGLEIVCPDYQKISWNVKKSQWDSVYVGPED